MGNEYLKKFGDEQMVAILKEKVIKLKIDEYKQIVS